MAIWQLVFCSLEYHGGKNPQLYKITGSGTQQANELSKNQRYTAPKLPCAFKLVKHTLLQQWSDSVTTLDRQKYYPTYRRQNTSRQFMDINHDVFHLTASGSFRDSFQKTTTECQLHEGTGDTKMEQVLFCSLIYLVNMRITLENTTENTTERVPALKCLQSTQQYMWKQQVFNTVNLLTPLSTWLSPNIYYFPRRSYSTSYAPYIP